MTEIGKVDEYLYYIGKEKAAVRMRYSRFFRQKECVRRMVCLYSCLTNFRGNYNIENRKCGEKEE